MHMINLVLLVSVVATGSLGTPALPGKGGHIFPSRLPSFAHDKAHVQPLRKRLANADTLAWEQTGTMYYVNSAVSGDPVNWTFAGRDTIVYNADGNLILFEQSAAGSGWAVDSLGSLDSSVYAGGNLAAHVHESFSRSNDSILINGNRETYDYSSGGKSIVETDYNWNDSKKTWVPYNKDSIVFSASIENDYWSLYYPNLVGRYSWFFDTTGSSWNTNKAFAKVDAECNATTLVMGGKQLSGGGNLVDAKDIVTFKSSVWTQENLIQELIQVKDASTGTYRDSSKSTSSIDDNGAETDQYFSWNATLAGLVCMSKDSATYDGNGFITSYETFGWDTMTNSLVGLSKYFYFPDSYGNDTLEIACNFVAATHAWDTTSTDRYERTYDASGNNTETINSKYDMVGKRWETTGKEVHTFIAITTHLLRSAQTAAIRRISINITALRVIVTAPNSTGLVLYNAAGRMVASVKQQAAGAISLDLSKSNAAISSGIYIAKVVYGMEQACFRLAIRR